MSDYIRKYRKRLNRSGNDIGDVYANNTITFIESNFKSAPTYREVGVVSTEFPDVKKIDTRIITVERMGNIREVLFRPRKGLNIGSYIVFDNDTWLIYDKWGSEQATKIKTMVQKCNATTKWRDIKGFVREVPCIAVATPLGSKANQGKNDIEWNKFDVSLPAGQLFNFTEANPLTRQIRINDRFIFGSNVYEVFGVDDSTTVDINGYGIIQFTLKLTTRLDRDDFIEGIAYNDYKVDVIGNDDVIDEDDDKGGRPW